MTERAAPAPRLLALLWAPPLLLVALRWLLAWQQERAPQPPAWRLQPFVGTQDPWAWLLSLGWALGGLLLLALLLWGLARRGQGRWVRRLLLALWWLLCLLGAFAQLGSFYNLHARAPLAPLVAEIMGRHVQAPSLRAAGGTLLVLRLQGAQAPDGPESVQGVQGLQQLLLDDPAAAALQPHQRLQLQWAQGRWYGRYVSAWQTLAPRAP